MIEDMGNFAVSQTGKNGTNQPGTNTLSQLYSQIFTAVRFD